MAPNAYGMTPAERARIWLMATEAAKLPRLPDARVAELIRGLRAPETPPA